MGMLEIRFDVFSNTAAVFIDLGLSVRAYNVHVIIIILNVFTDTNNQILLTQTYRWITQINRIIIYTQSLS